MSKPLDKMFELFENKVILFLILVLLVGLYFSPYLIKGKEAFVLVHDNLDSLNEFSIFDKGFKGHFFPSDSIDNHSLPGVEKIFFVQYLFLDRVFFLIFGYFWGFVFNEIFYRIIAFLGIFFLLNQVKGAKEFPVILKILAAFAFTSLPFYPPFNAAVAGIPMVILLFHNLFLGKKIYFSFICLFLFTFYSGLFNAGAFIIFMLILVAVYLAIKKKLNKHFTIGILVLIVGWVISHYQIFLIQFYYKIPTTRMEMDPAAFYGTDFIGAIKASIYMFWHANFHARSYHIYIILPSLILIGSYLSYKRKFYSFNIALALFGYIIFASLTNGLYSFTPILNFYGKFSIGFNLGRLFVLSPPVWYILWAVVLINFYSVLPKRTASRVGLCFIIVLLLSQVWINSTHYSKKAFVGKPSFKEFVSEEQFSRIKKKLKLDMNDRIGCIGFFPTVANYNGLKTIGAYKTIYPLKFKHNFYNIIKDELEQNQRLKKYFLKWGSRAYLFDDKIATYYGNQHHIKAHFPAITCDLNIQELKKFGVTYLFSTAEIVNAAEKKLELVITSKNPLYYYRFYVYRVN